MATARDKNLISQVRNSAISLNRASIWVNSNLPLNITDDQVYELYMLFRLISDLMHNYEVRYVSGIGNKKYKFPRKPSNKFGRPRFEVHNKSNGRLLWQICAGTKVADKYGKERSPDISFQKYDSPESPSWQNIEMIWDAKFKKASGRRITHNEFSSFAHWVDVFNLRHSTKPTISFHNFTQLIGNCLVTNGAPSSELDNGCLDSDLKEVTSFYPGNIFSVRP